MKIQKGLLKIFPYYDHYLRQGIIPSLEPLDPLYIYGGSVFHFISDNKIIFDFVIVITRVG